MSRAQLAIDVADLGDASGSHSELFATPPTKARPGYADCAVLDPPLEVVLVDDPDAGAGTLDHLGVEVAGTAEVAATQVHLAGEGPATAVEERTECCQAAQDEVRVDVPGEEPWGLYRVPADAGMPAGRLRSEGPSGSVCCATRPEPAVTPTGGSACCCARQLPQSS